MKVELTKTEIAFIKSTIKTAMFYGHTTRVGEKVRDSLLKKLSKKEQK